jgi:translation initiation factor 2-alpha kinase 4
MKNLVINSLNKFMQARRQRVMEEALEEEERAHRAAQELGAQIEADMLAKELQYKARKRANSEATEVPASSASGYGDVDTLTESFHEMDLGNGVHFNTVKLFHPRTGTSCSRPPPTRF